MIPKRTQTAPMVRAVRQIVHSEVQPSALRGQNRQGPETTPDEMRDIAVEYFTIGVHTLDDTETWILG